MCMEEEIILADDHPLFLLGLKYYLEENGFLITATANDGKNALREIEKNNPKLAILDLEMPFMTGLQVAEACLKRNLSTKIILLTLYKEAYIYQNAKELNISGYLLKEFAAEELLRCINGILETGEYYSDKIVDYRNWGEKITQSGELTPSEKKILRLIADGKSTKEISGLLFVSERTIDKHRSNIIKKLKLDKKHNSLLIWAHKHKDVFF